MESDRPNRREEEDDDLDGGSIAGGEDAQTTADAEREAQEIIAMKARVAEMEKEAAMLRKMTAQAESEAEQGSSGQGMTDDEKEAVDSRSIYVGNVRFFSYLSFHHLL